MAATTVFVEQRAGQLSGSTTPSPIELGGITDWHNRTSEQNTGKAPRRENAATARVLAGPGMAGQLQQTALEIAGDAVVTRGPSMAGLWNSSYSGLGVGCSGEALLDSAAFGALDDRVSRVVNDALL